jgi:hypothetical protein
MQVTVGSSDNPAESALHYAGKYAPDVKSGLLFISDRKQTA